MDWKLGVVAIALASQPVFAQNVTQEADRFTGQTKLDYTNAGKAVLGVAKVSIFAKVGGKTPITGVRFMIAPRPTGRYGRQDMPYVGCRKIEWLVDGKPMDLGMVVYDYIRVDPGRIDVLTQEVSDDALAEIGAASTVEYRLCGVTQGQFDATDIAAARQIAARIKGAPAQAPQSEPVETPESEPAMKYRPKF